MAMSELLECLRTICGRAYICSSRDDCDDYANCWEHRAAIIDAVERELSERYMELPLDADGTPLRMGDDVKPSGNYEDGTVASIELRRDGSAYIGLLPYGWDVPTVYRADTIRHTKPDTWERIISDAIELGYTDPDNEHLTDRIVARCRALAGEGE